MSLSTATEASAAMSHRLNELFHHHKGAEHMSDKPSIVFCHGIWADGSCFSKLIPPLRAEGYQVISAQYNLDSAQSDIDSVIRTLGRVSSPSILVGHSYGGAVITGAGIDDRVVGLVYIAAVAPEADETAAEQQQKYPTTDLFGQIEVADGRIWMLPSGIGYFCGDLSEEEQEVVWATATPPAVDLFNQKPAGTAWKSKPSAFVVATNDHAVHPDLERDSAARMGATTYEVASSHVPMLSHPDVVLDAIRNLVASLQETLATA
jgi:pimeloyl-ACP methyl ester carboxylesterase